MSDVIRGEVPPKTTVVLNAEFELALFLVHNSSFQGLMIFYQKIKFESSNSKNDILDRF